MSEIKIRAWNKESNIMRDVICLHNRNLEVIYTDKGLQPYQGQQGEDWDNQSDVELIQSIGFKDINNKEIYKGDILSVKGKDLYAKIIETRFEVKIGEFLYDDGEGNTYDYYGIYLVERKFLRAGVEEELPFFGKNIIINTNQPFEIIGNIYENPNLI